MDESPADAKAPRSPPKPWPLKWVALVIAAYIFAQLVYFVFFSE